jgi:hypothetical protein
MFSYKLLKLVADATEASDHVLSVLDGEYPAVQQKHLAQLYLEKGSIIIIGREDSKENDADVQVVQTDEKKQRVINEALLERSRRAIRVLTWQEVFGKPDTMSNYYGPSSPNSTINDASAWSRSVGHAMLVDLSLANQRIM